MIIYYDQSGAIKAVGAEATFAARTEREKWVRAEWKVFDLWPLSASGFSTTYLAVPTSCRSTSWLSPKPTLPTRPELHIIAQPLPLNKPCVEIFGDLLHYIFECTTTYIRETHPRRQTFWDNFGDETRTYFVLTHSNGCSEGPQQTTMRKAAIRGGLVPNDAVADKPVYLVTGERQALDCRNR
jgi:hypothetical protein